MTLRDAEYWAKRFRQLEEAEHDKSSQYIYENVEKQFTLAIKELEKEITAWVQRFAEDNALSMAEARKRLTTKELQEFKWTVEDYIKHGEENHISGEWTKQLRNASDRVHVTRLDSLKLQMQQHLEALYGNQVDMLDKHLQETYADSYYHTAYEVAKGQEVAVQMNRLDNARLASVVSKPWVRDGKTFSDRLWRDKDTLNTVLQEQLSQAVIRGEPLGNITKNMRDRMSVATSSAARLVSTESAFFATAAQQKCFSFLGVKEYEFVATLDDRTSEICQDMDGKHFKLTDMKPGTNAPPMHCNCRSCIAPYFDDAKDSGRAARNLETGKTEIVPADMTYPEWKKTYVKPSEFINEERLVKNVGNKGPYTVAYDFINSKKYHDNFENLTDHKPVNEALYKKSGEILCHRNGTEYEDIAMLDSKTGETLAENQSASGANKFKSGLTRAQSAYLENLGKTFEVLHNHPGSSMPSLADIKGLFARELAVASTVIGHDGSVYRMQKLKNKSDVDSLCQDVYNYIKEQHPDWDKNMVHHEAVKLVISELESKKVLAFVMRGGKNG